MLSDTTEITQSDSVSTVSAIKRFASRFIRGLSSEGDEAADYSTRELSGRSNSPRSTSLFRKSRGLSNVFRKSNTRNRRQYETPDRNSLSSPLAALFQQESLADLLIISEDDETIYGHRSILACQSIHFRKLIEKGESLQKKKSDNNEEEKIYISQNIMKIRVKSVNGDILRKILGFLYSGTIELCDADVIDIFLAANTFLLSELKLICENHVSSAISCDSLQILLETSRQLSAKELERRCLHFFENNVDEIVESDAMLSMPKNILRDLLCRDFYIQDEYMIFETVLRWGKSHRRRQIMQAKKACKGREDFMKDIPSLKELLSDVVPLVRLIAISVDDLERRVFPENVIDENISLEILFKKLQHGLVPPPKISANPSPDAVDDNGDPVKYYLQKRRGKWKKLTDFPSEEEYTEYLKEVLRPGMLVLSTNTYEQVEEGDIGRFVQYNTGIPPCQVTWQRYGNTYWLYFRDIEIID